MFFRIKKSGHRAYVQVVENKRFDGAVRQSVIANLGRADDLIASGALASLLASGAKFTDQVLLITTLDEDSDGSLSVAAKRIGGPLLFGRIWERLGIADGLGELLKHRAFEFAVERAVFVGTLHRLFVSGSDRDCASWMADYDIAGVEGLDLEARFDGIFVLRTNAKITPLQAVLRYRDLLKVENLFLRTKAVMRTRPIFHSSDAAIRGHVICSFLALVMQKYLEDLSCQAGVVPEWKSLLRDLDRLQQVRIRHRGNDWVVRTNVAKPIVDLFRHAQIAMPPRAKQMAPPKLVPTKSARKRRGRPRRGATSLPISPKAA